MDDDINEVLDIAQRMKRAQILRRYKGKIERAREVAQRKMAPEKNIKKRAYAAARQIVRKRFAGARGAEYEKLGPSEKMAIDRAIEKKQALIKKIALRLIPKVKQAEQKRLQSFIRGQALVNAGAAEGKKISEEFNVLFSERFEKQDDVDVKADDKNDKTKKSAKKGQYVKFYNMFGEEAEAQSAIYKSIVKKAERSGIDLDILGEVYNRGFNAWNESISVSPQQYAFARVNSYINQGKTYFNEDSDLHEGRAPGTPSIRRYKRPDGTTALKSLDKWGKRKDWRDTEGGLAKAKEHAGVDKVTEDVEQVDELSWGTLQSYKSKAYKEIENAHQQASKYRNIGRAATKPETKAKNAALEKAHKDGIKKRERGYDLAFAKMNPDTKGPAMSGGQLPEPKITTKIKRTNEETQATKARKKIEAVDRNPPHTEFAKQAEIKTKIIDEQGNCQNDPKKRLTGTDSLVKAYKKDTPGASKDMNESFNIAYAAGIGQTFTAADLGMKIKGGFEYHPSVIEHMDEVEEAVKTADKAPVVVPSHTDAYGHVIPAKTVMRKKGKVIVNPGDNPSDGK